MVYTHTNRRIEVCTSSEVQTWLLWQCAVPGDRRIAFTLQCSFEAGLANRHLLRAGEAQWRQALGLCSEAIPNCALLTSWYKQSARVPLPSYLPISAMHTVSQWGKKTKAPFLPFYCGEKPEAVESLALQKYKWPGFDSCRRFKADYFKNRWNLKPQPSDYSSSLYLTQCRNDFEHLF